MIHNLTNTLKSILDDTSLPELVRNAEVTFDRPAETYSPSKTTINLFLYDVRENTELRSNEPIIERQNGVAIISRPPLRVSCSYLVTVWVESGMPPGEQAILDQHQLLGEVLKVFSRMPIVKDNYLEGELKNSLYPVSLVTAQTDLMRNPAEFWSALGGKLRPSFTVTAVIAVDQNVEPVKAHLVSSKQNVLGEKLNDEAEFEDEGKAEQFFEIAGVVTDKSTGALLEGVKITLIETDKLVTTDKKGQYCIAGLEKGTYHLRAEVPKYSMAIQAIEVADKTKPGSLPTSFDIELSPI